MTEVETFLWKSYEADKISNHTKLGLLRNLYE
jgi:hypothetical protein